MAERQFGFEPRTIVAGEVGVAIIDERERSSLLSEVNVSGLLQEVAQFQRRLDIASTTSMNTKREELSFISSVSAPWVGELRALVNSGHRLAPPVTITQLIREAVEFGSFTDGYDLDRRAICALLLSISSEQNRHEGFSGDVPTPKEMRRQHEKMSRLSAGESMDMLLEMIPDEAAAMLFNAPLKLEVVQSTTFETWFSAWPSRVTEPTLGETPAEAFEAATGASLVDVLRLGDIVSRQSFAGNVLFDVEQLVAAGATEESVSFMAERMAMKPPDYRASLEVDRGRGEIRHQRYTMTQYPFLEIEDDKFLLLRHQWGLDRFIGNQLYWETLSSFEVSHSSKMAKQFSQAMDYMFEHLVGSTLQRIFTGTAAVLITEPEMQAEWGTPKKTPSVCDWAILEDGRCTVIDATNHPLNFKLAQGLGDAKQYGVDVDKIFTNKKFDQLISTMDLLSNPGWKGMKHEGDCFMPLVVVPDSSVPNTRSTEIDFQRRAKPKFERFATKVYPPGVISYSDLRLLEGICEKKPVNFLSIISRWRRLAIASFETLQGHLDNTYPDRPLPRHIFTTSKEFKKLLTPGS
ncbi:hypothetical protein [Nocardia cyriacigeorgica]|uniref:hypothetical protein n=1 Tax=Nocardia cyriacigeorgica TaxID=135487 RepID=UPI0018954565|nr:hypothetical protein [Nocardia cyriacigeorgica]MBF6086919.1 hypothetical protein [Nocardia cyriacigeorgica]MBF6344334.1 hypothetical protein [Nocardia cyriacigeorgica]